MRFRDINPYVWLCLATMAIIFTVGMVSSVEVEKPISTADGGTIVKEGRCTWYIKDGRVTVMAGPESICHGEDL